MRAQKTLSVKPRLIVKIMLNNVNTIKKNLCLCIKSETAPRKGASIATKSIDRPKDIPKKSSGACFSMVTQRIKYRETIFKAKNWLARSYSPQAKINSLGFKVIILENNLIIRILAYILLITIKNPALIFPC